MAETTKEQYRSASFSPRHVAALAALSNDCTELFGNPRFIGIQVEPVPDGGVTLSATNGSLLVWVNDPDGRASETIVIDPCDEFIAALRPPKLPPLFTADDGPAEVLPPTWMVPGQVIVASDADGAVPCKWTTHPPAKGVDTILIVPEENPPGFDNDDGVTLFKSGSRRHGRTQTIKRPVLKWGEVVPTGAQAAIEQINLSSRNLQFLTMFGATMRFRFYGEKKAVIVDFDSDPNVHAAIMPCDPQKFIESIADAATPKGGTNG